MRSDSSLMVNIRRFSPATSRQDCRQLATGLSPDPWSPHALRAKKLLAHGSKLVHMLSVEMAVLTGDADNAAVVQLADLDRDVVLLLQRLDDPLRLARVVEADLSPLAPSLIRRVLGRCSALSRCMHARRARSPQIARAHGAHLRAYLLRVPSAA